MVKGDLKGKELERVMEEYNKQVSYRRINKAQVLVRAISRAQTGAQVQRPEPKNQSWVNSSSNVLVQRSVLAYLSYPIALSIVKKVLKKGPLVFPYLRYNFQQFLKHSRLVIGIALVRKFPDTQQE